MTQIDQLPATWAYKISGQVCNLTRGVFNRAGTGAFISYEHLALKEQISVEMSSCPMCNDGRFWITLPELEQADYAIECEHCGIMLAPVERCHDKVTK